MAKYLGISFFYTQLIMIIGLTKIANTGYHIFENLVWCDRLVHLVEFNVSIKIKGFDVMGHLDIAFLIVPHN